MACVFTYKLSFWNYTLKPLCIYIHKRIYKYISVCVCDRERVLNRYRISPNFFFIKKKLKKKLTSEKYPINDRKEMTFWSIIVHVQTLRQSVPLISDLIIIWVEEMMNTPRDSNAYFDFYI